MLHPEWNALTPEEQRENPARRAAYALRYRRNPGREFELIRDGKRMPLEESGAAGLPVFPFET